MNFLSPAFLLALPLVAVPVVIHLLSRRQQKRIAWGAMRFLLQVIAIWSESKKPDIAEMDEFWEFFRAIIVR